MLKITRARFGLISVVERRCKIQWCFLQLYIVVQATKEFVHEKVHAISISKAAKPA